MEAFWKVSYHHCPRCHRITLSSLWFFVTSLLNTHFSLALHRHATISQDIQVEAGPQDGTLLVTWQPVTRPPSSGPVTGYAVYADGKKVTDVDSPTGDHALIDIGKLVGLNPRAVTVRTKSRDSQSADSQPTQIPSKIHATYKKKEYLLPLFPCQHFSFTNCIVGCNFRFLL